MIKLRKNEAMQSVYNRPTVPESVLRNTWGLVIRNENMPNERSRTIDSSSSRNRIGSVVPHFWFAKVLRFRK